MNRQLVTLLASLSIVAAACAGGSSASSAEARALTRARDLAAATTIEGGKSMFEYPFPNGRLNEEEPTFFGRSH